MKWVVVILLGANLLVYLVGNSHSFFIAPTKISTTANVNVEGMMLLHEIHAGERAVRDTPDSNLSRTHGDLWCYRIGPFSEETNRLSAEQWMNSQQFAYHTLRTAHREMRSINVYLGPFASLVAAVPTVEWLNAEGFEYFVDSSKPQAISIFMGYFTQDELAKKFIAYFLQRAINANTQTEYRTLDALTWLEGSVAAASHKLLRSHRWPEKGAALHEVDCQEIAPARAGG